MEWGESKSLPHEADHSPERSNSLGNPRFFSLCLFIQEAGGSGAHAFVDDGAGRLWWSAGVIAHGVNTPPGTLDGLRRGASARRSVG